MNETETLLADFKDKFQKTLNEAMTPILEQVREVTQRVEPEPQGQAQEEQISDAVQQWLHPNIIKEQAVSEASDGVRQWLQGKEDGTNEGKQI
ncbi:MAG: hypothetical protein SNI54_05360 [Rikenellaceae bacterium]